MSATVVPLPHAAVLTVTNPSGQRSRVPISKSPFLLGRQADNHLVLRDNRVSRVHARIVFEAGHYHLEDLASRHGTYVNGDRTDGSVTLRHSDRISFGFPDGYFLTFLDDEREITRLVDQVAMTPAMSTHLAKLRALVEVARALQTSLSMQEVLESVVDAALTVTGSERGFLFLRRGDHLDLRVARDAEGGPLSQDDLHVPLGLIYRALQNRRELWSMNFAAGSTDSEDGSLAGLELRSVVCVPLVRVGTASAQQTIAVSLADTLGVIYLDSRVEPADLSAGNQEILQTLALEASTVLENARLLEQDRDRQRLESELRIARAIQQDLWPHKLPSDGWFRVAASSIPSELVGGDYYDVAQLNPGCWSFLVADVSGKGVSSALLASLLQGTFLLAPSEPDQIRSLFARLNHYLCERTEGEKFATVFYGALHQDGTLHWCNAGHGSPLQLSSNGWMRAMPPTALPVGMLDETVFEVETAQLVPGDRIVVFSDGLTDAQNSSGEMFESSRVDQVLQANAGSDSHALHAALLSAVDQFTGGAPQRDDITLMVLGYCGMLQS
jgi:serine phosphatase RsbU (regulator of sigma subunit)